MQDKISAPVPKWPFFLGDIAMLGMAYFIYSETRGPLGRWEFAACGLCVLLGAALGVFPFLLDHKARLRQMDAIALGSVSDKIQKLEQLAIHISAATTHWEMVQSSAEKTSNAAGEITERISTEAREFAEFMTKANDGEKATLRLEVEKLRRAEGDWLQVVVHLLDHVYALHAGALRSGQPRLIEQLTHFQNVCRDAARRVGLVPVMPAVGEAFDSKRHQSADKETASPDSVIKEVLAPGFTFQGRFVRPAAVRLAQRAAASATAENQLSLET
jgi:molecular chaperone GrpE (heat shock protein)